MQNKSDNRFVIAVPQWVGRPILGIAFASVLGFAVKSCNFPDEIAVTIKKSHASHAQQSSLP